MLEIILYLIKFPSLALSEKELRKSKDFPDTFMHIFFGSLIWILILGALYFTKTAY